MMRRSSLVLAAAISVACPGWADLTIRYSFDSKIASFVPPDAAAQLKQQFASVIPAEAVVRIKGNRAVSTFGALMSIADYGKGQITLLDPKKKQYATVALADYADKLAAAIPKSRKLTPETEQLLGGLNFDVQTGKTGQSATIQGMTAEESLMVISIQAPSPQGVPAVMQMEIHYWLASPNELGRRPELKELADYMAQASHPFEAVELLGKAFSGLSGFGDRMRMPMEELSKLNDSLVLRLRSGIRIPAMEQALRLEQAAGFDPSAPLAEYETNLAEISMAPIDDAAFAMPADFHAAPIEELVSAAIEAPQQVPTGAAQH